MVCAASVIRGFIMQMGDPTGTGKGGQSIWGGKFPDELRATLKVRRLLTLSLCCNTSTILKHNARGIVAMANSGPDTNASQLYITFAKQPHLDNKNTIFGRYAHTLYISSCQHRLCSVISGNETLDALERRAVDAKSRPVEPVYIESVTIHANPIAELHH